MIIRNFVKDIRLYLLKIDILGEILIYNFLTALNIEI